MWFQSQTTNEQFLEEFQNSSKSCNIEIKSKIYDRCRNSTLVLAPDTEIWFQLQTTDEQLLGEFQSQFPPKFLRIEIKFKIYVTMLNYCQKKILLYFHEDVLTLLLISHP